MHYSDHLIGTVHATLPLQRKRVDQVYRSADLLYELQPSQVPELLCKLNREQDLHTGIVSRASVAAYDSDRSPNRPCKEGQCQPCTKT